MNMMALIVAFISLHGSLWTSVFQVPALPFVALSVPPRIHCVIAKPSSMGKTLFVRYENAS